MSVGNFYSGPEGFGFGRATVGNTPGFDVQLDGFAKILAGTDYIFALRSDAKFRAPSNVPTVFLGYEGGEAVSHEAMLANLPVSSK
jgi:hypothetical protein